MKKKLKLPNITLLSATSTEMDQAQISMKISLQNIEFGAAKLLCTSTPKQKYPDIEYVSIPPLNSVDDYNEIIFQDLHKYFETSHCLIVQSDSFVVNSSLWKEEFLQFAGEWFNGDTELIDFAVVTSDDVRRADSGLLSDIDKKLDLADHMDTPGLNDN